MPKPLAIDTRLNGRLSHILDSLDKHEDAASKSLPGFHSLLKDWLAPEIEVDRLDFMPRFLKVFMDSNDNTYQNLLGQHSDDEKHRLEGLVEGVSPEDAGKGFQMLPNPATRQEVDDLFSALDKWTSYSDAEGKKLRVTPHWAKEWVAFKVDGKPWVDKAKIDFASSIAEFKRALATIGQEQGWTLNDLKARFSNDLFDKLIFSDDLGTANGANGST